MLNTTTDSYTIVGYVQGACVSVPQPAPDYWWRFARAGVAAFVTTMLLALFFFEAKSAPLAESTASSGYMI